MMTRHTQRNAKFYLLGSASAFLMAAGAQAAYAADESAAAANDDLALVEEAQVQTQVQQQQQQQADEALELEEIVVTGSRIARSSMLDTLAPTVSISETELQDRGFTNVADALNELPAFANSLTPNGNNNGFIGGANFPNLFGLGSQRTLTLVDSKRFVSSNPPTLGGGAFGLQVDTNVIPTVLVERTDVVSIGGAPIYGSDAIAGTVNIIMKDDFEGLHVQGQYSAIQNGSDPETYQAEAAWGANTADGRGNVAIGVQYNRNEGEINLEFPEVFGATPSFFEVPNARDLDGDGTNESVFQLFDDRRIGVIGPPGSPIVTPTTFAIPNGPPFGIPQALADSLSIFPNADGIIRLDGTNQNIIPHTGQIVPGEAVSLSGGNSLDLSDFGQVVAPLERFSVFGTAHFDIFEWLEAYGQVTFANTESEDLIDQGSHNTFVFGEESAALGFPIDTPFLSDEARQELIALGAGDTIFINRNLNDVDGGRIFSNETFTWRFVGGFRGDFKVLGRNWGYDVAFNYGQSDLDTVQPRINDGRFFNAIDAIELTEDDIQSVADALGGTVEDAITALDGISGTEVGGAGEVICRSVLEAARGDIPLRQGPAGNAANDVRPNIDGCVPLNLLGGPPDPRAVDFVIMRPQAQSDINQRVFTLSLDGELVKLPAGWVQFVAGYETRRERGNFDPSAAFNLGLGRFAAINPTEGDFSTDEFFSELIVPVVSPDMNLGEDLLGFKAIEALELEGAYRRVDNSLTGSDDIWTAGGRLRFGGFLSDLQISGNFTESTRNPAIAELFSAQTDTFEFADDPCDFEFINEGPSPENRRANCAAIGLSPDFNSIAEDATVMGLTGGNPTLDDEKANSFTVGGTYTPSFLPGFLLEVNVVQVNMSDRITNLTLEDNLQACFDQDPSQFDPNLARSFDPGAGPCGRFVRDADGQIDNFLSGFANAAESSFKGLEFNSTYSFSLTDAVSAVMPSWGDLDWGNVSMTARAFHRIRNELSVVGEDPERVVGGFAEPKWNGTFDFRWNRGPARFTWRVEWQDSADLDPEGDDFFEDRNGNLVSDTSARIINNGSFSYTFFDNITAQVTVDNIFNREATDLQIAAGDFGTDEIFGRTYLFTVRADF